MPKTRMIQDALRVGLTLLILSAVHSGCRAPETSVEVARAYLEAIAANQPEQAWELLSTEARQSTTRSEFYRQTQALTGSERADLRQRAEQLQRNDDVASWRMGEWTLRAQHTGNQRWRVTGPLPRFDQRQTPLDALKTFARAFRYRDFEVMLSLAPEGEREGLSIALLEQRLYEGGLKEQTEQALSALLRNPQGIRTADGHWQFSTGRHVALFQQEHGLWKLIDLR